MTRTLRSYTPHFQFDQLSFSDTVSEAGHLCFEKNFNTTIFLILIIKLLSQEGSMRKEHKDLKFIKILIVHGDLGIVPSDSTGHSDLVMKSVLF